MYQNSAKCLVCLTASYVQNDGKVHLSGEPVYTQQCKSCKTEEFPYEVSDLICSKCKSTAKYCLCKREKIVYDETKPHLESLCGRCQHLGRPCYRKDKEWDHCSVLCLICGCSCNSQGSIPVAINDYCSCPTSAHWHYNAGERSSCSRDYQSHGGIRFCSS